MLGDAATLGGFLVVMMIDVFYSTAAGNGVPAMAWQGPINSNGLVDAPYPSFTIINALFLLPSDHANVNYVSTSSTAVSTCLKRMQDK